MEWSLSRLWPCPLAFIETVIGARIELLPCSQDENSVGVISAIRLFLFDEIIFQVTLE